MSEKKENSRFRKISIIALILIAITAIVVVVIINSNMNTTQQMALGDQKEVQTREDITTSGQSSNGAYFIMDRDIEIVSAVDWSNFDVATEKCTGFYADIDEDGEVDGVIYADLAKGNTGSGVWSPGSASSTYVTRGTYTIPKETNLNELKNYYISQTSYEGKIGTMPVISPASGGGTKDRFYVMALADIDGTPKTHYWYNAAYSYEMTDYAATTKEGFGEGKKNTENMINKWNSEGYGAKNAGTNANYNPDMWGIDELQAKAETGWFVPSLKEWAAFGGELGIDTGNYSSKGLSSYYWSSSQYSATSAYYALFYRGYMNTSLVYGYYSVRLSATF